MNSELIGFCDASAEGAAAGRVRLVTAGAWTACLMDGARWAGALPKRIALRRAVRRQQALEQLLEHGAVVPVAPGARVRADELPQIAVANAEILSRAFAGCRGMVQYEIDVTWAEDKVLAAFRPAPEIAPLFAGAPVAPQGVAAAVEALRTRLAGKIAGLLAPVARETVVLSRTPASVSRLALLVPHTRKSAFDQAVEAVDGLWTDGFRVRQIGPAPAAAFGTLLLTRPARGARETAEARLGLASGWVDGDLAAARRGALLAAEGPDAARDVRDAERLLSGWAAAGRPATPPPLLDLWREGQALPRAEAVA